MSSFKCEPDETFSAYVCILLFDTLGYELHPQAIQQQKGAAGLGVYCTLDREKALELRAAGKEVLIAEFCPTPAPPLTAASAALGAASAVLGATPAAATQATSTSPSANSRSRSGGSQLYLMPEEDTAKAAKWRKLGYSGVVYDGVEMCIRVDCIQALYRREWTRPESAWDELQRLTYRMNDSPLAIDSDTVRTEVAWAKATERLKNYGDQQVDQTRQRLENAIRECSERSSYGCAVS